MKMKKVTLWSRRDADRKPIEFNHLADGWCSAREPEPVSDEQRRAWKGAEWFRRFAYLTADYVVVDLDGTTRL